MSTMCVKDAFHDAYKRLADAGIDSARVDARLLVGLILGGGAERVLADSAKMLSDDEATALEALVQRRLGHEPMSHIIGAREFWSLNFKVTPATLTPRPDTETLIETVLDLASVPPGRVLDLGTGSGCILLTLLKAWPHAHGVGVDASTAALDVAGENARTLDLDARARFVHADWTQSHWTQNLGAPFDVVVSNPPYIPDGDIATLDADVRDFEPRAALAGGADGLAAYRTIVAGLDALLTPGGLVAFEVGIGQAAAVAGLLDAARFAQVKTRVDLGGIERVVAARK